MVLDIIVDLRHIFLMSLPGIVTKKLCFHMDCYNIGYPWFEVNVMLFSLSGEGAATSEMAVPI